MNGDPTAILMAVSSTRRHLHEPRTPRPRRPRRANARALQALAVRLDPGVVQPQEPQLSLDH
jgi:hypothetical protein